VRLSHRSGKRGARAAERFNGERDLLDTAATTTTLLLLLLERPRCWLSGSNRHLVSVRVHHCFSGSRQPDKKKKMQLLFSLSSRVNEDNWFDYSVPMNV
jgi:hypothetical protein